MNTDEAQSSEAHVFYGALVRPCVILKVICLSKYSKQLVLPVAHTHVCKMPLGIVSRIVKIYIQAFKVEFNEMIDIC